MVWSKQIKTERTILFKEVFFDGLVAMQIKGKVWSGLVIMYNFTDKETQKYSCDRKEALTWTVWYGLRKPSLNRT